VSESEGILAMLAEQGYDFGFGRNVVVCGKVYFLLFDKRELILMELPDEVLEFKEYESTAHGYIGLPLRVTG